LLAQKRPLRVLGMTSLAQVSGDLAITAQAAFRVAQCRDHDVGPEPRAVLANPPALVFQPPELASRFERAHRLAFRPVLVRVERLEVAADDLVRCVALDPLGSEVPGRHPTVGIEHEDGVVLKALDQ
jgi:hypothetical protein